MSRLQEESVSDLSEQVMDTAQTTAFALMKSNYVERNAPEMLDGKIKGVTPRTKDRTVRIRDSIWARFDSLRFHYTLLIRVHEGHEGALDPTAMGMNEGDYRFLWNAAWQEQFLFDDLVFNSASLFDYLATAIWFGFHGHNYIKKDWGDVTKAAREADREPDPREKNTLYGSHTGELALRVDRDFVGDLYGYRADLIHDKIDAGTASSELKVDDGVMTTELRVSAPENYSEDVKALLSDIDTEEVNPQLNEAAEHLILKVGDVALDLLEALQRDLDWDDEPITMLS